MNTTKTELLEELESIVNLAMMQNRNARTSELARDYENGLIKNIKHLIDRYKYSVRKETISKCIKMNDRHGAIPNDFRHWYQDMRETNNNTTREK